MALNEAIADLWLREVVVAADLWANERCRWKFVAQGSRTRKLLISRVPRVVVCSGSVAGNSQFADPRGSMHRRKGGAIADLERGAYRRSILLKARELLTLGWPDHVSQYLTSGYARVVDGGGVTISDFYLAACSRGNRDQAIADLRLPDFSSVNVGRLAGEGVLDRPRLFNGTIADLRPTGSGSLCLKYLYASHYPPSPDNI
ncbi:hypothetical protein C7212DRAFT_346842 [Tuber magnatum]|uniref:Uncharacterized protein n=1 Tax=Tuber magnatum TaxID=42249 RepID=A0A317SHV5_9PEZI|nr:hypothetical protein C7212DRAFT_346842 [Tuber magnatum]